MEAPAIRLRRASTLKATLYLRREDAITTVPGVVSDMNEVMRIDGTEKQSYSNCCYKSACA